MSNSNMNVDANKTAVGRFLEDVMTKNRPELLDQFCVEDFVLYWRDKPIETGLAEMKEFVGWHDSTFPGLTWEIKDLVAENDMVAARTVQHGIHKGEWRGARPTGKKFSNCEALFFRFRDGKIAKIWVLPDHDDRKEQLGFRSLPPDS
jgi:predicted ester cyclase